MQPPRQLVEEPFGLDHIERGLKRLVAKLKKKGTKADSKGAQDVSAQGTVHSPTKPPRPLPKPKAPKPPDTAVDPLTGKEVPLLKHKPRPKPWTDPKTGKQYYISPSGKKYPWDPQKALTPFAKKPRKLWTSAGGVVIPSMDDFDHVYVIKPSNNYGPWAFPKGQVDKGESMKQAALREVWEETGLKAKVLPGRGAYVGKGKGTFSITHFFLMVRTGGFPRRTEETEQVRLVTWDEAKQLFHRSGNKRDPKIADLAQKALQAYKK